jgi:hypothetical protein
MEGRHTDSPYNKASQKRDQRQTMVRLKHGKRKLISTMSHAALHASNQCNQGFKFSTLSLLSES